MSLLDHVRTLVEAEQGLTEALEKCLPLLSNNNQTSTSSGIHSSSQQVEHPLLPTPRSADEVPAILAVARAYSLRTSAPPMWNPNLPVVGFATPNPLPHQLRGGALGALQLKMAREERNKRGLELLERQREKDRRRKLEEEDDAMKKEKDEDMMDVEKNEEDGNTTTSAKRKRQDDEKEVTSAKKDIMERQMKEKRETEASAQREQKQSRQQQKQTKEEYEKKKEAANMNLSDSSSSSSSSDSEDGGSDDDDGD